MFSTVLKCQIPVFPVLFRPVSLETSRCLAPPSEPVATSNSIPFWAASWEHLSSRISHSAEREVSTRLRADTMPLSLSPRTVNTRVSYLVQVPLPYCSMINARSDLLPGFGNKGSELSIFYNLGGRRLVTQFTRMIIANLYIDKEKQSMLFYII